MNACADKEKVLEWMAGDIAKEEFERRHAHIKECGDCNREMRFFGALKQSIMEVNMNDEPCKHPLDDNQLSAYLDQTLPEDERKEIERHLVECNSCRREMLTLSRILASLQEGMEKTPVHLKEKALARLYTEKRAFLERIKNFLLPAPAPGWRLAPVLAVVILIAAALLLRDSLFPPTQIAEKLGSAQQNYMVQKKDEIKPKQIERQRLENVAKQPPLQKTDTQENLKQKEKGATISPEKPSFIAKDTKKQVLPVVVPDKKEEPATDKKTVQSQEEKALAQKPEEVKKEDVAQTPPEKQPSEEKKVKEKVEVAVQNPEKKPETAQVAFTPDFLDTLQKASLNDKDKITYLNAYLKDKGIELPKGGIKNVVLPKGFENMKEELLKQKSNLRFEVKKDGTLEIKFKEKFNLPDNLRLKVEPRKSLQKDLMPMLKLPVKESTGKE